MNALRIILTQNKACYKKPEADLNKMTYPLPPFSTVIGAIHSACRFTSYHPMDISIQGSFQSMGREVYRDHSFLNSLQNDRGILVKLRNAKLLSTGFTKVAAAQKSQDNDFEKEITIEVLDRACLDEYQQIKADKRALADYKKENYDPLVKTLKQQIKRLKEAQKEFEKGSEEFLALAEQLSPIVEEEQVLTADFKEKKLALDNAYAKFTTLTTSIKHYEVLYGVQLILHIQSDDDTLQEIYDNIFNLRALGRSEDFVDIQSCEFVALSKEVEDTENPYSAYVKVENVRNKSISPRALTGNYAKGTMYYLNKDYTVENHQRVFHKKFVLYISDFEINNNGEMDSGIFIDSDGYVVNFV